MRPVHVALPTPLWQEFTYLAPKSVPIGTVVQVSFGTRILWGVIWKEAQKEYGTQGLSDDPKKSPVSLKIKTITATHPFLKISPELMQFMHAMAGYIICPLGLIVKMTLPPAIQYAEMHLFQSGVQSRLHWAHPNHQDSIDPASVPPESFAFTPPVLTSCTSIPFSPISDASGALTFPAPQEVEIPENGSALPCASTVHPDLDPHYIGTTRQWASHHHKTLVTARSWIKSGFLKPICPDQVTSHPAGLPTQEKNHRTQDGFGQNIPSAVTIKKPLVLSPLQETALQDVRTQFKDFLTVVLDGITGSGKTEVILALSQDFWQKGLQVLVLLPEIMLSYPWCQRVEQYFDIPLTVWHSGMSPRLRQEGFENISMGRSLLVIGARSALCLPYARLGLIVVDEEHEAAYKQTDSVCYHGRDMAVFRGKKENIPVVLASATPSIETRWNVQQNKYGHVRLNHRYGVAQLPVFSCIDMRPHPPKENAWISPVLQKTIQETLDKGEQSLLFLNRRGYACLWMCYRCGYRAACTQCSAWLTVHEKPAQLLCHYCAYHTAVPKQCPGCGDDQGILMMGPGIERIAKEIMRLFPTARTAVLSSDHVLSASDMTTVLDKIANREIDILIGTQLIAKGYHFPYLTCIGIVDTDFALSDMDFRASERLFQLLYQVAGRAGRAERPGQVLLQTLQPDYPLFQKVLTYDWDGFVTQELEMRKAQDCPPMTRLIAVIVSHKQEWSVQEIAMKFQKTCPKHVGIQVFGPAPAPLNPLRGRYRWRFLLKAKANAPVYGFLMHWLHAQPLPKGIAVDIDRDPYTLL